MIKRSPFIKGAISEVKTASGFRPLMTKINGVWQVITIVDHDDVDLALDSLKPFAPQ